MLVYVRACSRSVTCRLPMCSSMVRRNRPGEMSIIHAGQYMSMRSALGSLYCVTGPIFICNTMPVSFLSTSSAREDRKFYKDRWGSRIVSVVDGAETRERHYTYKAITLYFPDPHSPISLQSLIDHWHKGGTYMQACTHPPRILLLRISCFREDEDGCALKLHTRVAISHQVRIPCYRDPGPDCDLVMYTVVACVLDCGAATNAGHYTARHIDHLRPQIAPHAPPQWKADDGKPIEPIRTEPTRDAVLSQQCYVILHCRS